MSLYQKLVSGVLFPLDLYRGGDGDVQRYLREFEETQFYSRRDVQNLAWERVKALLPYAYEHCPFYRKRFDAIALSPHDILEADDMLAIPLLEKHEIQDQRDHMVSRDWPRHDLLLDRTGGSTGKPISYYRSTDRHRAGLAATIRHDRWAGRLVGDRAANIWGASRDLPSNTWKQRLRNLLIDRTIYLDTGHITAEKMLGFNDALKRFRPRTILAYANSIVLMARLLKAKKVDAFQPDSIITSAEVLDPHDRLLLENVFGCPVFNRYGCREVGIIASECSLHQGLHIMAEGLYIEVVRENQTARPGELGEVVVTDLLNLAMPLIRYRIGDLATFETAPCGCGRGLPRLRNIAGRVTDFVVGSDGRLVSGAFLTVAVVAKRPTLGQVQLWQEACGRVLYKIAPGEGKSASRADLEFLASETKRHLGAETKVDYEFVEHIASEPSGKFLFSRSAVASDFLTLESSS